MLVFNDSVNNAIFVDLCAGILSTAVKMEESFFELFALPAPLDGFKFGTRSEMRDFYS